MNDISNVKASLTFFLQCISTKAGHKGPAQTNEPKGFLQSHSIEQYLVSSYEKLYENETKTVKYSLSFGNTSLPT
jgi:hypothetical protein